MRAQTFVLSAAVSVLLKDHSFLSQCVGFIGNAANGGANAFFSGGGLVAGTFVSIPTMSGDTGPISGSSSPSSEPLRVMFQFSSTHNYTQ